MQEIGRVAQQGLTERALPASPAMMKIISNWADTKAWAMTRTVTLRRARAGVWGIFVGFVLGVRVGGSD